MELPAGMNSSPDWGFGDTTPPDISIVSPVNDRTYGLYTTVNASYSCVDFSDLARCAGTVASGAPIDTSSPGRYEFSVTASDRFGNVTTKSLVYQDLGPPSIDVSSPRPSQFTRSGASFSRAIRATTLTPAPAVSRRRRN